jgi:hypothetical protein
MVELAEISAEADDPAREGKFAIVAPSPIAFGMARMYQAFRESSQSGNKRVEVFRTLAEALAFLKI